MSPPSAAATRYGLKCSRKNARTARASAPSIFAPSAHGACHVARFFGSASNARQPTTNAGHAAATLSSFQPGRSDQAAGVNTARGAATGGAGTGVGGGGGATVWQPASAAHSAAADAARRK